MIKHILVPLDGSHLVDGARHLAFVVAHPVGLDLLQLHSRQHGPGSTDTRTQQASLAHACHGCRIDPTALVGVRFPAAPAPTPGLVIPPADRLTLPGR